MPTIDETLEVAPVSILSKGGESSRESAVIQRPGSDSQMLAKKSNLKISWKIVV